MKTVISASRRTDIPAFYLDWFFSRLDEERFVLTNPYNGRVREVAAGRENVAAIVFWSKNYGPLLRQLKQLCNWNCVFNFTINSHDPLLEPGVPPLEERMEQMAALVRSFGPEAVRWRFDPVVFYYRDGRLHDNLHAFSRLLNFAAGLGIRVCTISFMDPYRKIARRERTVPDFAFEYPDSERMLEVASKMAATAAGHGVKLLTCCEPEIASAGIENLAAAGCIDHALIEHLYGEKLSRRRDRGQRSASGCLCHESIDIGSYDSQPCRCDCLYCYANPVKDRKESLS
jgi:DNA repair photolyase